MAAALLAIGIEPGERVAILSHTRLRWVEADLGILHAGAATVPIYPTLLADSVGAILNDCGARCLFAEDPVQLAKVLEGCDRIEHAVLFEPVSRLGRPDEQGRLDVSAADVVGDAPVEVHLFDDLVARGRSYREAHPDALDARAAEVTPDSVAAIYYTSGTEGEPKGVLLTHDNFVFETEQLRDCMPVGVNDEQLLFLPLAHIVAKLTVMLQLRVGFVTSFAASIDEAAADSALVRPTFIVGVPRVFEKIQEVIEKSPERDVQRRVFDWAMTIGRDVSTLQQRGRAVPRALAVQHRAARRLVFDKIHAGLGGQIRFMLSGAAPLQRETAEFFHAVGLLILEGYGLTETTGASTLNLPHRFRFGTVGRPLPGVTVKLADDREVLLRGRSVTSGYHEQPEATRAAFTDDGFFRTGDIGEIDEDGFLVLTDRKKDLIVTAGGKNVAPARIETMLRASPYIEQAVVIGDRRKFPVALICVDGTAIRTWARANGLAADLFVLSRHPRLRDFIGQEVEKVNARLASFESIKRFEILPESFHADRGELTPTGKVRRNVVGKHYADLIDALYEGVTTELEDIS